ANRLHALGHKIIIVHSLRRPFKKMKSPLWWKKLGFKLTGAERPDWFPLKKEIPSVIVNEISDKYLPDADIVFSTWWQMAYAISKLSPQKGKPVNLIQDYELWSGQEDRVHASYQLPVYHATYANYLTVLVEKYNPVKPMYIPIAIDTHKFFITQPIKDRKPHSIMMLYSEEERKGTKYGIEAFIALKENFPDLAVTLFSVYTRPADLPDWIQFYTRPGNLPELYNQHAIFFSPSLGEGWALPPAEAMACGCAVVCTNIGGHADYAFHDQTALLVESKNPADMEMKLEQLLTDNDKRIKLAFKGNKFLTENFNWERSTSITESYFYSLLPGNE
ncbi:MAG TPA: glycosyltransferase family 4 protein, partial [Chitinophagaceae bacterium]|nr:glycosyltransferase family 4 protein [Chitinophagaceae bacterium]